MKPQSESEKVLLSQDIKAHNEYMAWLKARIEELEECHKICDEIERKRKRRAWENRKD